MSVPPGGSRRRIHLSRSRLSSRRGSWGLRFSTSGRPPQAPPVEEGWQSGSMSFDGTVLVIAWVTGVVVTSGNWRTAMNCSSLGGRPSRMTRRMSSPSSLTSSWPTGEFVHSQTARQDVPGRRREALGRPDVMPFSRPAAPSPCDRRMRDADASNCLKAAHSSPGSRRWACE